MYFFILFDVQHILWFCFFPLLQGFIIIIVIIMMMMLMIIIVVIIFIIVIIIIMLVIIVSIIIIIFVRSRPFHHSPTVTYYGEEETRDFLFPFL